MAPATPQKARRRNKKPAGEVSFADDVLKHSAGDVVNTAIVRNKSAKTTTLPETPLESLMWSARGESPWIVLTIILMVVGLFRWAAGLWGYSGMVFQVMDIAIY
jgi:alpha-1,3-glucosyltransferase